MSWFLVHSSTWNPINGYNGPYSIGKCVNMCPKFDDRWVPRTTGSFTCRLPVLKQCPIHLSTMGFLGKSEGKPGLYTFWTPNVRFSWHFPTKSKLWTCPSNSLLGGSDLGLSMAEEKHDEMPIISSKQFWHVLAIWNPKCKWCFVWTSFQANRGCPAKKLFNFLATYHIPHYSSIYHVSSPYFSSHNTLLLCSMYIAHEIKGTSTSPQWWLTKKTYRMGPPK